MRLPVSGGLYNTVDLGRNLMFWAGIAWGLTQLAFPVSAGYFQKMKRMIIWINLFCEIFHYHSCDLETGT